MAKELIINCIKDGAKSRYKVGGSSTGSPADGHCYFGHNGSSFSGTKLAFSPQVILKSSKIISARFEIARDSGGDNKNVSVYVGGSGLSMRPDHDKNSGTYYKNATFLNYPKSGTNYISVEITGNALQYIVENIVNTEIYIALDSKSREQCRAEGYNTTKPPRLVITYEDSSNLYFGVDGAWKKCEVYYGENGTWKKCETRIGINNEWKKA